jgi:hypothetical protein
LDTNFGKAPLSERAAESGCFFVAPILFMAPKPGAPKPPEHHIDMYRRFYPKVFSPFGDLISWDVFGARSAHAG